LKPQQRDLTLVLRRPVELAPESNLIAGQWSKADICFLIRDIPVRTGSEL